jgi:Zn-dependent protease
MRIAVGPIAGVRVVVSTSWLIIAVIVVLVLEALGIFGPILAQPVRILLSVAVAGLFLISLGLHELAHALAARRLGVDVDEVGLSVIGTQGDLERRATSGRAEIAIALAGPLVSLPLGAVLVGLSLLAQPGGDPWLVAVGHVAWLVGLANLLVGALNLLPGYPFDGGRLLRGIVWSRTGSFERASGVSLLAGRLLAYAVMGVGLALAMALPDRLIDAIWLVVLGWLFHQSNKLYQRRLEVERLVAGLQVGDVMEPNVPVVMPSLTIDALLAQYEQSKDTPVYPVTAGGVLVGAVDVGRARRLSHKARMSTRVEDLMTRLEKLTLLTAPTSVMDALASFDRSRAEALPVVDEAEPSRLVGILTRQGLVLALRARRSAQQAVEHGS